MDNIEKAKKWFKDLFMGCYLKQLDKYPNYIFWIYDKNLIRQKKLSKITGIEKFNLEMSEGDVIFEQDENNCNFWIKYENYWDFLESNFNLDYDQVKNLTTDVVNEILNCKQYSTTNFWSDTSLVNEVLNYKQYYTDSIFWSDTSMANEVLSSKQDTTDSDEQPFSKNVYKDILNYKQYTTVERCPNPLVIDNDILNYNNYTII